MVWAQEKREAKEAAVRRVIRGFDTRSVDEAPFRPEEFAILNKIERDVFHKQQYEHGGKPPLLWSVSHSEGSHNLYLQRWNPTNSGPPGLGVSARGNKMLVFTGEKDGLRYTRIEVTGHPGPWNAEARQMAGELKRYAGSDDDIARDIVRADSSEWMTFKTSVLSRIFDDPDAQMAGGRASAAELERAKQIVEGRVQGPSGGSGSPATGGRLGQQGGLGRIPSWVWVAIGLGVLFLMMKGR